MISVVVPVYNAEKTLHTCLNSILKQTYSDFEVICVDDNSTDSSLEILDYFSKKDSRIRILKNNYSKGLGYCLNKGLAAVKGEFIFFLNSRDWISFDAFEILAKKIKVNSLDMVIFKNTIYDENTHAFTQDIHNCHNFTQDLYGKIFNHSDLNIKILFETPSDSYNCFYSKAAIENNKIAFSNKNEELIFTEFFYKSLISVKNISLINKSIYILRKSVNNTAKFNNETLIEEIKKSYQIFKIFLNNNIIYKHYKKQLFDYINDFLDINQLDYKQEKILFNELQTIFQELILKYELQEDIYVNLNSKLLNKFGFDKLVNELKNTYPLVSVIIPVYNVENYLNECLDSVLSQTFSNFEILCINDGSTDKSPKILKEYSSNDKRIKIINQENCGLGCARNVGLKHSKGNYVVFLDSDDYISNNLVELLYHNISSNHTDMALYKIVRFNDAEIIYDNPGFPLDEIFTTVNFNRFVFKYEDIKKHVLNSSFSASLKIYKKEFLDKFDLRFTQGTAFEDVLFHVQSLLNASMSFVPEFLYYYRINNESSITHNQSNVFDIIKVCDSVEEYLKKTNYYDEFELEFCIFKISQLYQYILSSQDEEYFNAVKNEFKILNNQNRIIEELPNTPRNKFNRVLNSDNLNEFIDLLIDKLPNEC